MPKLNPLHIARIINGESPEKIDPEKGTGQTTANALRLLARAIEKPNGLVRAPNDGSGFSERLVIAQRALELSRAAGLSHVYPVTGERDAIIFEYRQ